MEKKAIAIIGAGHGGTAMAAHLSFMGAQVNLCDLFPQYIEGIKEKGGIHLTGACGEGFARLHKVTADLEEALADAALIMVVTPSFTHRLIAEAVQPYLKEGQIIVLNPGRTGGALEFLGVLKKRGPVKNLVVAETQTLIYACRKTGPAQAVIMGLKKKVDVASIPAAGITRVLQLLNPYFPQFQVAENVLHTSLQNIGAVFHPTPVLLNIGRIETPQSPFEYYMQGISPSVAKVLEKIDAERVRVAAALGIQTGTVHDWLRETYETSGDGLYELLQNNGAYRGIMGPDNINTRYVTEDIPMSLVPIAEFGAKFGVATPVIDAVIAMAEIIYNTEFRREGRTLEKLGLKNMSKEQVLAYCTKGSL